MFLTSFIISKIISGKRDKSKTITHSIKFKLTSEKNPAIGGIKTTIIKITNEASMAIYKYLFFGCFLENTDKVEEC